MKRAMLCKLLSLLCLALTGTVCAQETCDLRWRVVPGQTLEYETIAKGLAPMNLQSGPQADALPIHVDLALDMAMITRQLCKSVDPDGSGHFEQGFPLFNVKMGAKVGNQVRAMEMKWEDGSLTMLTSGQVQPVDAGQKRLAELLGCTLSMICSPRGKTTCDTQNMSLLNELMSTSSGVQMDMNRLRLLTVGLPDHPVGVGDTWTVTDTEKIGEATATSKTDFKLAGIETVEGIRTARIEGEARLDITGEMPGNAPVGMPMKTTITALNAVMTFVNHFDIEKGNMLLTDLKVSEELKMIVVMGQGNLALKLPANIEKATITAQIRRK